MHQHSAFDATGSAEAHKPAWSLDKDGVGVPWERGTVLGNARILTKNYGNAFLRALPKCPVEVV
jgi:hypothetical protein